MDAKLENRRMTQTKDPIERLLEQTKPLPRRKPFLKPENPMTQEEVEEWLPEEGS